MLFYMFLAVLIALFIFLVYCYHLHKKALKSELFFASPLHHRFHFIQVQSKSFAFMRFAVVCYPELAASFTFYCGLFVVHYQPLYNKYSKPLITR